MSVAIGVESIAGEIGGEGCASTELDVIYVNPGIDNVGVGPRPGGAVVDVVCRAGLAVGDSAEAPGSVGLCC